jgi:hypothetical protein
MNKLAAYKFLLADHPLWEKTAFSSSKLLPVGTTIGGAALGGVGGAMSTKDPEKRKERALMGAVAGGLSGGLGGEVLRRGAVMRNLKQHGDLMSERASEATREAAEQAKRVKSLKNDAEELSRDLNKTRTLYNQSTLMNKELQERMDFLPENLRDALRSRQESGPMFKQQAEYLENLDRRILELKNDYLQERDPQKKHELVGLIQEEAKNGAELIENLRKHRDDIYLSNVQFGKLFDDYKDIEIPEYPIVQSDDLTNALPDRDLRQVFVRRRNNI